MSICKQGEQNLPLGIFILISAFFFDKMVVYMTFQIFVEKNAIVISVLAISHCYKKFDILACMLIF